VAEAAGQPPADQPSAPDRPASRQGDRLPTGAKLLALDVGDARIGVAAGTVGSLLAFGRGAIGRQGTRKDVPAVLALVEKEGAAAIVVGIPVRLDGSESPQTERVRRFAAALAEAGADVVFEDERLTTRIAQRPVSDSDLPRSRRQEKGLLDEAAAVQILESYLRRLGGPVGGPE